MLARLVLCFLLVRAATVNAQCTGNIADFSPTQPSGGYTSSCTDTDVAVGEFCFLTCSATGWSGSRARECQANGEFEDIGVWACGKDIDSCDGIDGTDFTPGTNSYNDLPTCECTLPDNVLEAPVWVHPTPTDATIVYGDWEGDCALNEAGKQASCLAIEGAVHTAGETPGDQDACACAAAFTGSLTQGVLLDWSGTCRPEKKKEKMSTGAIFGTVAGSLLGVGIGIAVWKIYRPKRKSVKRRRTAAVYHKLQPVPHPRAQPATIGKHGNHAVM